MKVGQTKFWVYKPRKRRWEEGDEEKEDEYKLVPHSKTASVECFCSIVQISTFSINITLIF
jgi:hypothetical protein